MTIVTLAETRFVRAGWLAAQKGSLAHLIAYLPFIALGFAAALLRIALYLKQLRRRWLAPQPPVDRAKGLPS